ncbi:hypothetical protein [Patulibacter minatonensis]|uniref:hypothetical protein n=1 Tax=Patulibacter minatonensis TaxID=298163 RepID=UPI00047D7F40|nr:hypothetical protein [Patulibacter minatonensis]
MRPVRRCPPIATVRGATCAVVVLLVGGVAATPASARVARLEVDGEAYDRGPTTVRITTADPSGAHRTLGPFRLADHPGGILAAPDGRHAALLPNSEYESHLWIAPLDGGAPVQLTMPTGVVTYGDLSRVGWSEDGRELVVGDAAWIDPAFDPDGAEEARPDQVRWTSLRCAVATGACAENPGPGGLAASIPGGVVVGSSALSLLPVEYLFEGVGDEPLPDWERATSERGRLLTGVAEDVRTSSTRIEGTAAPRILDRQARPATQGLTLTRDAVSGPSGALLTRSTTRFRLDRRPGKVRLRGTTGGGRLVAVAPDGTVTRRAVPTMRVPRREQETVARILAREIDTLAFRPAVGTPDRGWVGEGVLGTAGLNGVAVAVMDPEGRARLVRVRGRIATPAALVAAARGLPAGRKQASGPLRVVGYERATRRAIVRVSYEAPDATGSSRSVALRVRLDGRGRPVAVEGGADTAW